MTPTAIFHLTSRQHWVEAEAAGSYVRSTVDSTLEEVGFIHCCTEDQIPGILERYWGGGDPDTVVLTIDPDAVGAEVKVENGYPHIYGPLPVSAVTDVRPALPG
ncbi:MAG TPA: DUF952 domain-containing protein [Acidimicrobiales bacterium]|nr:DUF952 domain-containing protein [Acidimicrobiales bacterium]